MMALVASCEAMAVKYAAWVTSSSVTQPMTCEVVGHAVTGMSNDAPELGVINPCSGENWCAETGTSVTIR